jgi:hypothetical protein
MNWYKEDIRLVVALPEWQALRRSFVGTWKVSPSENVSRLRAFLGDCSDSRRIRIVHNYLTGSGFRIGVISHPTISALLEDVRDIRKKKHLIQTKEIPLNL